MNDDGQTPPDIMQAIAEVKSRICTPKFRKMVCARIGKENDEFAKEAGALTPSYEQRYEEVYCI